MYCAPTTQCEHQPTKYHDTPNLPRGPKSWHAPDLGEHTQEVLTSLGFSDAETAELQQPDGPDWHNAKLRHATFDLHASMQAVADVRGEMLPSRFSPSYDTKGRPL